jgi:3-hydroxyisobutyrate dehydrogenase-like beta-hydroxyacid dehydrogenase
MVRRLTAAGHLVRAHDRDPEAARRAGEAGAQVADDAAEAASGSEVCILSLPDPGAVRAVVSGDRGVLGAAMLPAVVVDTSTVDPTTSRHAAERAHACGVGYLDAPVLGRPDRCGNWVLPVGGDGDDLRRARATLEVLARDVVSVGPSGSGNVVKLLNNLMFAAINAVTAECLANARSVGIDPDVFVRTVADSGAASVSNLFREIGPKIVAGDYEPAFALALLHKDVGLARHMIAEAGGQTVLAEVLAELGERGIAAGLGHLDTSALVEVLRPEPRPSDDGGA